MNDEQYCRATAEACGFDLTGSMWTSEPRIGECLLVCPRDRPELAIPCIPWHPHTNVAQALEVYLRTGMIHKRHANQPDWIVIERWHGFERPQDIGWADPKDYGGDYGEAWCAAIRAVWEAGQ